LTKRGVDTAPLCKIPPLSSRGKQIPPNPPLAKKGGLHYLPGVYQMGKVQACSRVVIADSPVGPRLTVHPSRETGVRSISHCRTRRPRWRRIGAASFCKRTSARTLAGNGAAARRRRRASFAVSIREIASSIWSIPSSGFPTHAAAPRPEDTPRPSQLPSRTLKSAAGPCLARSEP